MILKRLHKTPLPDLVECLVESFQGYFVPIPNDLAFWQKRFAGTRVDYGLSIGVFDKSKLIAFVVNGVGADRGKRTAFNTGTGVLASYRGNRYVDKIYELALLPILREDGFEKCKLEVIDQNERAIRVYERIGFKKTRRVKCYKGTLSIDGVDQVFVKEISARAYLFIPPKNEYSWDHTHATVEQLADQYTFYQVGDSADQPDSIGRFVINRDNGYLAQYEYEADYLTQDLFKGIQQIHPAIRINNVIDNGKGIWNQLPNFGLENSIDQFEMEMEMEL